MCVRNRNITRNYLNVARRTSNNLEKFAGSSLRRELRPRASAGRDRVGRSMTLFAQGPTTTVGQTQGFQRPGMQPDSTFADLLVRTQQMARQIAGHQQPAPRPHARTISPDDFDPMPWLQGNSSDRDADTQNGGNSSIDSFLRSASLDSTLLDGLEDAFDEDDETVDADKPIVQLQSSLDDIVRQLIRSSIQQSESLLTSGDADAISKCAVLYASTCSNLLLVGLPSDIHHALQSSMVATANANPEHRCACSMMATPRTAAMHSPACSSALSPPPPRCYLAPPRP